jgi:hypothetical protein
VSLESFSDSSSPHSSSNTSGQSALESNRASRRQASVHRADPGKQSRKSNIACSGSITWRSCLIASAWQFLSRPPLPHGQSSCPFGLFFRARSRISCSIVSSESFPSWVQKSRYASMIPGTPCNRWRSAGQWPCVS